MEKIWFNIPCHSSGYPFLFQILSNYIAYMKMCILLMTCQEK